MFARLSGHCRSASRSAALDQRTERPGHRRFARRRGGVPPGRSQPLPGLRAEPLRLMPR